MIIALGVINLNGRSAATWLAIFAAMLVSVAATGCVESRVRHTPVPAEPTATATPMPTATATPVAPPSPTPVPTATAVPPSPTPVPTAAPVPTAVPTVSTGTFNLTLEFEGIDDERRVFSDTVLLRGLTSADAIVSVNDVIVAVQPDGSFELTLVLDPGPNFVDVVASNLDGSLIRSSLGIVSILPEETP
jgi:hypothetical protein